MAAWQETIRGNAVLAALPRLTELPIHLVGGAVRDVLRGKTRIQDWDILIPRDALAVARRFAETIGGAFVALHDEQPTARVVQSGRQYDIIQYRGGTLEEDLRRRDMTVNAIAVDLRSVLIGADVVPFDPCGGVADIAAGILRPCAPDAFRTDPLRAIRLYRFAAALGYAPAAESVALAAAVAAEIPSVAPERITDELARLFAAPGAAPAIEGLVRSGLWEAIVPEAAAGRGMSQGDNHHLDVFDHDAAASVAVIAFVNTLDAWAGSHADDFRAWLDTSLAGERTRRWIVPFAALLHDIGKPTTHRIKPDGKPGFPRHEQAGGHLAEQIAAQLRLSRPERRLLGAAIRQHGRPNDLQQHGPEHPLRLFAVLGDVAPACILVAMGDRESARGPNRPPAKVANDIAFLQGLLRDSFGVYGPLLATPPLVSGDDVMRTLRLPPGKAIGRLLLQLRARQLRGRLVHPADALRVARDLAR